MKFIHKHHQQINIKPIIFSLTNVKFDKNVDFKKTFDKKLKEFIEGLNLKAPVGINYVKNRKEKSWTAFIYDLKPIVDYLKIYYVKPVEIWDALGLHQYKRHFKLYGGLFTSCNKTNNDDIEFKPIIEINEGFYFSFTDWHIRELQKSAQIWYDRNMGNKVDFDMMRVVMTILLKPNEFNNYNGRKLSHDKYLFEAIKKLIPTDTLLNWY